MALPAWRIVFFGTAEISTAVLSAILEGPDRIVAVVSQPDRPTGRGRRTAPTPIREAAERRGLALRQPEKMRDPELIEWLRSFEPDLFLVAAFGRILKPEILDIPGRGCVNVHTSLLPKYRGAAPIQWAVANDERVTGVTIMMMDEGMDTGDILLSRETDIGAEETAAELSLRLARIGGELALKAIEGLKAGSLTPRPQDDSQATTAPMLRKEDGLIDWGMPARLVASRVRGFTPWPGTYTRLDGKLLKVLRAVAVETGPSKPGTVLESSKHDLLVACGQGALSVTELQPEGKKPMSARAFQAGRRLMPGMVLG